MAQQDIQISVPIIGVGSSPVAYADQILDEGTNMTLDEVAKKSASYGPYASVAAAHTALSDAGLNTVGTTVGISGSNNTIVEYWYQGGTAQANLVEKVLENSDINAIESSDGKIYSDYQAGDIFYIEENDVRKYRVALVAGTADAEHPVTISPVNFYYALNSADAINLSLTLKTVSTEQQSLSSQQKAQARSNIATIGYEAQTLTAQQKEQAAQNIGLDAVVKGDVQQSLSDAQKVQAQNNMMGKVYAPAQNSGLGKVYLDKNNGVLTQNVMNAANTIYVIQYDYDLDGENITVPENCVLEFDGGSLKNGTLTHSLLKVSWFGDTNSFCDSLANLSSMSTTIFIDKDVEIHKSINIGENSRIIGDKKHIVKTIGNNTIYLNNNCLVDGVIFEGSLFTNIVALRCINKSNIIVRDCSFKNFYVPKTLNIISISASVNVIISNCLFEDYGCSIEAIPGSTEINSRAIAVWAQCNKVLIKNNIFKNQHNISSRDADAICINSLIDQEGTESYEINTTIDGNLFYDIFTCPIKVFGSNCIISNNKSNIITNDAIDNNYYGSVALCRVYRCNRCIIINNESICSYAYMALQVQYVDNTLIQNNSIQIKNAGTNSSIEIISLSNSNNVVVDNFNCVVDNINHTDETNSIFNISSKDVKIKNSFIELNGAIGCLTRDLLSTSVLSLTNVAIKATGITRLFNSTSSPTINIRDCQFEFGNYDSTVDYFSGNLDITNSFIPKLRIGNGSIKATNSVFRTIHVHGNATATLNNCTFLSNFADGNIYCSSTSGVLTVWMNNTYLDYTTGNQYRLLRTVGTLNVYINGLNYAYDGKNLGYLINGTPTVIKAINIYNRLYDINKGLFVDKPTNLLDVFEYYCTDLNKNIIWNGSKWCEEDGATANVNRSGTFANKPSADDIYIGFKYFCTDKQTVEGATDGIEIIHKGDDVWVDALGRVVS